MNAHHWALALAGVIGSSVAIIHGHTFQQITDSNFGSSIRRLVSLLLQFSTFNWFIGGIALLIAAFFFQRQPKLATGLLVGSSYLFGSIGNLWATRRAHPGWMLYALAVCLIGYDLCTGDQD